MISAFRQDHPIAWRMAIVVLPFAAGIGFYFALAAYAPSYPQSIRDAFAANLKPLRELPIVMRVLGPEQSTPPESEVDALMKHYTALREAPEMPENVGDQRPQTAPETGIVDNSNAAGVTWNNTNSGETPPVPPLDVAPPPSEPFAQLAESTDADTRIRGLEALSGTADREAVRTCMEGLVDTDPAVRRHASRSLARVNGQMLYREWVNVLLHGPPDLLQAVDAKLPELQPQLEASALAALASGESSRLDKLGAMYTLGRIRSAGALSLLTGYAWSADLEIAQTAAAAIAETRSPKAVGALVDLTEHYDPDVRWYAVNGLGLLQGEDALAALEYVISSGLEPVREIRTLAVNHLANAGDPGSVATLIDAVGRYPGLRREAMYALSQITGITEFTAPFEWRSWYEEWSLTPEAQAAERRWREVPATQVAAVPVETAPEPSPMIESTAPAHQESAAGSVTVAQPSAAQAAPRPTAQETPPSTPAPETVRAAEQRPSRADATEKPIKIEKTSGGTGKHFGISDLSPAELMRQGGFSAAKP